MVFQIKKFDPSNLELSSNDKKLEFDCVIQDAELVVTTRLKLPTILQIISKGKNLKLTEFWLGNVKASSTMLQQICSVTYANNKTLSDTALLLPGIMRIEIYSKSFIEYHLLNKNFCIYE